MEMEILKIVRHEAILRIAMYSRNTIGLECPKNRSKKKGQTN
jgi:hypothetical protein